MVRGRTGAAATAATFRPAPTRLEVAPQGLVDALLCGTYRPVPDMCPRDSDILQKRPKWDGALRETD